MTSKNELQPHQLHALAVPSAGETPERERLMSELRITYDGRQYLYGSHRYDRFEDAASYARLHRLQPAAG